MNYNLLEEEWIPVLYGDGKFGRVNIRKAFTQADHIREIAASNPMDRVAILRFLLALLYWCRGNHPDDSTSAYSFPQEWFTKLEQNRDCFNLLGEGKRFYQDPLTSGKRVAATNLLHDLPSGTNIAHFRHVRDFREGLCPPCCAMGLLRWSAFASAGTAGPGQQMTASINGNTPAYTFRIGPALLETLLLNWPTKASVAGDAPFWQGATEESPLGILKGLTWQSRRVLLAPADESGKRSFSSGRCCYCAEQTELLIKSILFRPGWQRPSTEPWWDDPHLFTMHQRGKAKKSVPSSPGPDDPLENHAATWRSILQGMVQRSLSGAAAAAHFQTTLLAASQQLYKDARTHAVGMPFLNDTAARALLKEMEWLGQVTWRTTSARTREWEKRPKGQAVIDALCSRAAKGQAIRSALCATNPITEEELERAFIKLTQSLACADKHDVVAVANVQTKWRQEASRVIRVDIERVVALTQSGSPLRRLEARDRAVKACMKAIRQEPGKNEEAKPQMRLPP